MTPEVAEVLERPAGRDDEKPLGRHRRHAVRQPALDGLGARHDGRGPDGRGLRPHAAARRPPRRRHRSRRSPGAGLPWTTHRFWPRSGVTFAPSMPRNALEADADFDVPLRRLMRVYLANRGRLGRDRRRRARPAAVPADDDDVDAYVVGVRRSGRRAHRVRGSLARMNARAIRRSAMLLLAVPVLMVVAASAAFAADDGPVLIDDANRPFVVLTGWLDVPDGVTVDDAIIFDGDATIEGEVNGTALAFNGDVTISGTVHGDVASLSGRVDRRGERSGGRQRHLEPSPGDRTRRHRRRSGHAEQVQRRRGAVRPGGVLDRRVGRLVAVRVCC